MLHKGLCDRKPNYKTMKIRDLCVEDRPREKILSKGPTALSNAELLAIILHNGTVGQSVLDLSHNLLHCAGDTLGGLFSLSTAQMCTINGMGPAKASEVQAALELGRRFLSEQSGCERVPVTGPRMIYELMFPLLKFLDHEECWVLFLNKAHYVVRKQRMTTGGADSTVIDIKQIARLSLDLRAHSIVLVHNHPSGNARPSKADTEYTRLLHDAVGSLDINLLDHVIVCEREFYSFAEDTVLPSAA